MRILSIPDALLVYTGCDSKESFSQCIVNIAFAFDCIPQLIEHKYCSVNGTLVFRHTISFRTAIMSLVSEKILLESGQMYCINKINNVAWQDDDELCEFLGILEAKIRLRVLKHAQLVRNDMKYVAIATSDIPLKDCIRDSLKFLRCEFGINVVYKEEDGTRTRRSILFPATLLNTEEIDHTGLYSIVMMKPRLTYVLSSAAHTSTFGIPQTGEQRVDFETFISQYHTASEMDRIKLEVMPMMKSMEAGDVIKPIIEFVTPNGRLPYEVTIRNIGRSCMAVTFELSRKFAKAVRLHVCTCASPHGYGMCMVHVCPHQVESTSDFFHRS